LKSKMANVDPKQSTFKNNRPTLETDSHNEGLFLFVNNASAIHSVLFIMIDIFFDVISVIWE
jgi:hypothetical protein